MALAIYQGFEVNTDPQNGDFCFSACPKRATCKMADFIEKLAVEYVDAEKKYAKLEEDSRQLLQAEFHNDLLPDTSTEPLVADPRRSLFSVEQLSLGFTALAHAEATSVVKAIWQNECVAAMSQEIPDLSTAASLQCVFAASGYLDPVL